MAKMEPINIQVDPEALKAHIKEVLDESFAQYGWRLRDAANALDPEFLKFQDNYINGEVDRKVKAVLKERGLDSDD